MMSSEIPEMVVLHCLDTFENVSMGAEQTMLDRQRLCIKWQQKQGLVCNNVYTVSAQEDGQFQGQLSRDIARTGFDNYGMHIVSTKKRKAEEGKVAPNGDIKELKKLKEWKEDEKSKVTHYNKSTSNKSRSKADEASVVSEVQKTDYIHVRARRGQATDSHSLAERVRREKISERMKYLQELVPGCNKITGKAGMLDEIINYVQSLQRHVEFLSMKLATVDPELNFNFDKPFGKEVFTPCTSSYPTLGEMSELENPAYLQVLVPSRMDTENYHPEMGIQQELTEKYVDITSINHNSFTWDDGVMEIQGGFINFPSVAMDQ